MDGLREQILERLRSAARHSPSHQLLVEDLDADSSITIHEAHPVAPANQLLPSAIIRRDFELERRARTGVALWYGLDELVELFVPLGEQRPYWLGIDSSRHTYWIYFTDTQLVVTHRSPWRPGIGTKP